MKGLTGVESVSDSLEQSTAQVVYDESMVSVEQMKKAIIEEGYSTTDAAVKEEPRMEEEKI